MFNYEITHKIDLLEVEQSRTGDEDTILVKHKNLPARVSLYQSTNTTETEKTAVRTLEINLFRDLDLKVGQLIRFENEIYEIDRMLEKTIDFDGTFLFWYFKSTRTSKNYAQNNS